MAISYPLSLPSTPGFRKFALTADNAVGVAESPFTGQQQTYEWQKEKWLLDASLPPMRRTQAEAWVTFLVSLRGRLGTFYVGDSAASTPRGVATGTPLVNGTNTAGSKTVTTKGWTHNITGILLAGDYIQIGTGTEKRLYKNLTNANSDNSGHATLDIFPRLREGLSDNQVITITNCQGTFRLMDNARQWSVDEAMIYGIDFKSEEAI